MGLYACYLNARQNNRRIRHVSFLKTLPLLPADKEINHMVFDKSLGAVLLIAQVLFTLIVGVLFTFMLLFGEPVEPADSH